MSKVNSESNIVRLGLAGLVVLACIGIWDIASRATAYWQSPDRFVSPSRLIIVEVHGQPDRPVRLYLAGSTNSNDLRFDGKALQHGAMGISHYQSSVPLKGYTVSGTGRIYYEKAVINVDQGQVSIGDKVLNPSEFTIAPNGVFREGDARIAR